ncbi:MAG TPA: hypothetical protein VGO50_15925 [Pyrinomonadaceae bacterium]|jgi:hypothetical protein|nr:hypothetical protein [Pyrinomonadaceae bacterium]
MELNFDKEIDALLRQAARQETPRPAAEAHLDADELAAFSANALPVKARARAMEHLVDCGNCRTILSNLVFFENQEEEKPAAAFAVATPAAEGSSLIERILGVFKFPTLAYGMAALVVLFTGAIGLMVLRNSYSGAEMAQVSNKELSAATKAVSDQLQDTSKNETAPVMNTDTAANTSPMASAANTAIGGAFSGPTQGIPVGGTFAANTTSNAASTLRKDNEGPAELKEQPKLKSVPVVIDGISTEAAPPPPPAPATGIRQEELRMAKPQQIPADQVTRSQDNFRNNNVQNNILTPDGSSDKDRSRRAVTGEAGANLSREADRGRDEKEKLDANDTKAAAPAKTEPKKAAVKKTKKNTAAAAEASATPAPTPAKTPEPKKKPDDEERPPCK